MATLRRYARLLLLYLRLNISSALEYRESFYMAAAGMLLSNCSFIFFWWVAFSQTAQPIGGYDFRDVMYIWACATAAYGLAHIVFGNATRIPGMIMRGEADIYLLQPKDPLLSMLCARTELSAFGDLAYGVILLLLTNQGWAGILWFVLAAVLGGLLIIATGVLFSTLTFYTGNAENASAFAVEFMGTFSLYPEGIFGKFVRPFLYTLLPAAFVVHVPLKLARGGNLVWLPVWLLAAVGYCAVAYIAFNRGLKRYESGNLIITRL